MNRSGQRIVVANHRREPLGDRWQVVGVGPHDIVKNDGFTVIEMLIATAILVVVTAATFSLMSPAQGTFAAQLEVSDMQQRLRVAVDMLSKDLLMAGAGTYLGAAAGPLGTYVASVVPRRIGRQSADAPATFRCSAAYCASHGGSDTVTVMYVPSTAAQTTVRDPVLAGTNDIRVHAQSGCPASNELCGFKKGMQVIVFDDTGSYDLVVISNVETSALYLQYTAGTLSKAYDIDTSVAEVSTFTYWLKTDTEAETYQLMRYDGYQTDLPIADNVVGLAFEYFGDPAPAMLLRPVTDKHGPWTTYGPKPPALGVDNGHDTWGAGENCLFMVAGGRHVPRPELSGLGTPNTGPIKIPASQLTDGPWCPDIVGDHRFDADLLRIRKVKVTLRVQVANKAFRGPAGTLFLRGGTSTGGERYIPDQEIRFDITPRNLNLGR